MQKSARFPEDDPQTAGQSVVENEATPSGEAHPDPSWTLERLAVYAKDEVSNSFHAESQAILLAHKSAVHLFRAGHALALAREKCKGEQHGDWKQFKKKHGLADTTANDAIRLFESAKTEDALLGLGITEAKLKFGIARPKKPKKGASPSPRPRPPTPTPSAGDPATKADPNADQEGSEAAVSKEPAGAPKVGDHEGETPDDTDHEHGTDGTGLADETATTLTDELEEIAQRLSEINQDDFGKAGWTEAEIRRAKNAVAAVKQSAIAINRRLINEEPVA